ncbi:MAG: TrkA C-terminal domain-containing protein [Candidatus Borkfalkia sp.]
MGENFDLWKESLKGRAQNVPAPARKSGRFAQTANNLRRKENERSEVHNNIFDYIQLTPEYAIFEIPTPKSWAGKTIRDKGVRAKYNLNILAIKRGSNLTPLPSADYVFNASERLIVMCKRADIDKMVH